MDLDSLKTGEKVAAVGGGLAIVGAFLPWVDAGLVTVAGIDGDGIFTLAFGVIVLGIVLARDWQTADMIGTGALGSLTVLIVGNVYANLGSQTGQEIIQVSAGNGLHLSLFGGVLLVAAAAYGVLRDRSA